MRTPKITEEVINYATIQGVFSNSSRPRVCAAPKEASELALLLKGGSLAARMDIVEGSA